MRFAGHSSELVRTFFRNEFMVSMTDDLKPFFGLLAEPRVVGESIRMPDLREVEIGFPDFLSRGAGTQLKQAKVFDRSAHIAQTALRLRLMAAQTNIKMPDFDR